MAIIYGQKDSPTLDLNFAKNKSLIDTMTGRNLVTFSRTQTENEATYVGADGLIKYAAADEPRFDHNPETGESLGLLIEESRSNQIVNSQVFTSGSGYNQSGLNSITQSTSITTPQGLTDGVGVITESVGGTVHQVYTASTTQVTGYLTYSVFVKPNGRNYCVLCTSSFTHDLINGTTLGSASGEFVSATTVKFPNGWVRCTLTRNHSNTFDQFNLKLVNDSNNTSYSGDGTSGVYIWGAQREEGTFPTSYIPTEGTTKTRSADVASITGSNFSSWFNPSKGTFFTDSNSAALQSAIDRLAYNTGSSGAFALGTGAPTSGRLYTQRYTVLTNNTITVSVFQYNGGGTDFGPIISNKILLSADVSKVAYYTDIDSKEYAIACADNITTLSGDGGKTGDLSYSEANMMRIGYNSGYSGTFNGTISHLTYWPKRLPDTTLQRLTR